MALFHFGVRDGQAGTFSREILAAATNAGLVNLCTGSFGSGIDLGGQISMHWMSRPTGRWRATNPGTRSVNRFTRNWTSDTDKKIFWTVKPIVVSVVPRRTLMGVGI